jgi:hydroxyacylglutathione hydrolase
MGCGRLFEGTPAQMWGSLQKIVRWPDDTSLYCAHEYTQSNGRFALTVEPGNRALVERMEEVARLRAQGRPTIPTTVALEKATNPFLRASSRDLQAAIGLAGASEVEVFAKTRALKDAF